LSGVPLRQAAVDKCISYVKVQRIRNCSFRRNASMRSYVFKVTVTEDVMENGMQAFHADCPALKGCHTWGYSYEEALANIREAIELYVEDLIASGGAVPHDPNHGVIEWPTPAVAVNL
jgi:predicted RNase H-like HicB family nuclease